MIVIDFDLIAFNIVAYALFNKVFLVAFEDFAF